MKTNEFLYRRADIEDIVSAHLLALNRAPTLSFGRYIISATTPFAVGDLLDLRTDAPAVVARRVPRFQAVNVRGWKIFPGIDRVYVNERARRDLLWEPQYDFARVLALIESEGVAGSPLARIIGSKGYHADRFTEGPYPVE